MVPLLRVQCQDSEHIADQDADVVGPGEQGHDQQLAFGAHHNPADEKFPLVGFCVPVPLSV